VSPRSQCHPGMLEWLEAKDGAPTQEAVWGDKKPSFVLLSELLDLHEGRKRRR